MTKSSSPVKEDKASTAPFSLTPKVLAFLQHRSETKISHLTISLFLRNSASTPVEITITDHRLRAVSILEGTRKS